MCIVTPWVLNVDSYLITVRCRLTLTVKCNLSLLLVFAKVNSVSALCLVRLYNKDRIAVLVKKCERIECEVLCRPVLEPYLSICICISKYRICSLQNKIIRTVSSLNACYVLSTLLE